MTEIAGITMTKIMPEKNDSRTYYCSECDTELNIEVYKELEKCPYCKALITNDGVKGDS